jgi:phosphopantetheinyl transferase
MIVEVIAAEVADLSGDDDRLGEWLPPEERARAQRFLRSIDRMRFLTARVLLRGLLATRLHTGPLRIQFETTPAGKPFVRGGPCFNISHSGRWVVVAVSETEVGIDIETGESLGDVGALADTALGAKLGQIVHGTPAPHQREAFLRYWVIIEAVLKASGFGLQGLHHVQHQHGAIETIEEAGDVLFAGRMWRVARLAPLSDGVAGAVACGGSWTGSDPDRPVTLRLLSVDLHQVLADCTRGLLAQRSPATG